MVLSLPKDILPEYVDCQIANFFPDKKSSINAIENSIDQVIEKIELCFVNIQNKHFRTQDQPYFNHLNSDHYAMFLYFLSNTLYRNEEDICVCEKLFYLNKILHGVDVFYSVELPSIFLFCHPLATVLGRAVYSDFLLVYQGCTVGASREAGTTDNEYPVLGKYLALYMGASVLGKCRIGSNCKIASNSQIMDRDLDDNSLYIGTPSKYLIKQNNNPDLIWNI